MMTKKQWYTIWLRWTLLFTTASSYTFSLASSSSQSSSSSSTIPKASSSSSTNNVNVNFVDWISNAPHEITEWNTLPVIGKIPTYLRGGTLVRNGPGLWSTGGPDSDTSYSHIFDGLAKLSAYRITETGRVEYCNQFVKSHFYQKTICRKELVPTFTTGPILSKQNNLQPVTGWIRAMQALYHTLQFDNASVNVWNYDPLCSSTSTARSSATTTTTTTIEAITDAPPRSTVLLDNLQTIASRATPRVPIPGFGKWLSYEFLETAHPLYSLTNDDTYNVAVCLNRHGANVVLVRETPSGERRAVASVRSPDGPPYLHSFGLSHRHAVIVISPLRTNLTDLQAFLRLGMLRSMTAVSQTRIVVVDLQTESVVLDQSIDEPIYFYHSISTATTVNAETGEEIVSVRLCAYRTPDLITGEDQFMRLERCQTSADARNRITKGGTLCDVVCNLSTQSVTVQWMELPPYGQGFELPTTRYSRTHGPGAEFVGTQHPRYVYAYGTYACGSPDYDAWGLFKLEPAATKPERRIAAYYRQPSVYVSEPIFVANPDGTAEDDGVLLSQIYDGQRRETALLILDAKTMKVLATAWTGNRSPMDFHGAWFPHHTSNTMSTSSTTTTS